MIALGAICFLGGFAAGFTIAVILAASRDVQSLDLDGK